MKNSTLFFNVIISYIALRRGPLALAVDSRLGIDVGEPLSIAVNKDGYVDAVLPAANIAPYKHMLELCIPDGNGGYFRVTDYASAGKLWTEESRMAAWVLTNI